MEYRKHKHTGLKISSVGLGTFGWSGVYGSVDQNILYQTFKTAIDLGINFIDTADSFGQGRVEKWLGKWIKDYSREEIIISTKGGLKNFFPIGSQPANPENPAFLFNIELFEESLLKSLKRLQTTYIDIFHLHFPQLEHLKNQSLFNIIKSWKDEGLIRTSGAIVYTLTEAIQAIESSLIDYIIVKANIFSPLFIQKLLPYARKANVGIIIREPLANGFLTGKYTNYPIGLETEDIRLTNVNSINTLLFKGQAIKADNLSKFFLKNYKEFNLTQLSLRFLLDEYQLTSIIVGMKEPKHIRENLKALTIPPLREQDLVDLKHEMGPS
ncbi:MAG: aldo/keto reductase [Candidatus Hodarchaeales archaeon]|jgi:aryl-alcohol dehydrogenase-like predicted oxidoreductase